MNQYNTGVFQFIFFFLYKPATTYLTVWVSGEMRTEKIWRELNKMPVCFFFQLPCSSSPKPNICPTRVEPQEPAEPRHIAFSCHSSPLAEVENEDFWRICKLLQRNKGIFRSMTAITSWHNAESTKVATKSNNGKTISFWCEYYSITFLWKNTAYSSLKSTLGNLLSFLDILGYTVSNFADQSNCYIDALQFVFF